MNNQFKIILESKEVMKFFPVDLETVLGLNRGTIDYFGFYDGDIKVNLVRARFYLVPFVKRPLLPQNLRDLSLICTDDDRIRGSAIEYEDRITKEFPALENTVPLLIINLRSNWFQEENNPHRMMELQRYADHSRFRKKGLAVSTLTTTLHEMQKRGMGCIYVNFPSDKWPKSSKVIQTVYSSQELKDQINGYFDKESGYGGFEDFSRSGFFVLTDPINHIREYEKSLRIKDERVKPQ